MYFGNSLIRNALKMQLRLPNKKPLQSVKQLRPHRAIPNKPLVPQILAGGSSSGSGGSLVDVLLANLVAKDLKPTQVASKPAEVTAE